MIDFLTLKSQIVSLLAGHIGTYKFKEGDTERAIAVLPDPDHGYNYPNNGTETTGIEVVVIRPMPKITHFLGGDVQKEYRTAITLKQWNADSSLLEATEALVNGLVGQNYLITSPKWVPPNPAMGIIEQVFMELVEYEFQELARA